MTYEAAEPQSQFSGGCEPRVQLTESGEPEITFAGQKQQRQAQDQQQAQGQQPGQQPVGQQQAEASQAAADDWRGGRQAMPALQVRLQGYERAEPTALSLDDLMGAEVYGAGDNNIGTVQDVVASQQGQVEYVVLDVGGVLEMGAHQVALGMDEVSVMHDGGDDLRVYVGATREQLEQMPEYQG